MSDTYLSFTELSANERPEAYRIVCEERGTKIALIAPHAGKIESWTSEICRGIAKEDLTYYLFEGCKSKSNYGDLHITSTNFDEPKALAIAGAAEVVVTVHGQAGADSFVNVGGLNKDIGEKIIEKLVSVGYAASRQADKAGIDPKNICNRGNSGLGVQLEISLALRSELIKNEAKLSHFSEAIRMVLLSAKS